jgi:hypothetical protein
MKRDLETRQNRAGLVFRPFLMTQEKLATNSTVRIPVHPRPRLV